MPRAAVTKKSAVSGLAWAVRLRKPSAARDTSPGRAERAALKELRPCSKKTALPAGAVWIRVSSARCQTARRCCRLSISAGSSRTNSVSASTPFQVSRTSAQSSSPRASTVQSPAAAPRRQPRRQRKATGLSSRAAITQAARKGAVQGSTKRAPSHSAPTAPAAVSSRERLFASRSGTAVPSSFVR